MNNLLEYEVSFANEPLEIIISSILVEYELAFAIESLEIIDVYSP